MEFIAMMAAAMAFIFAIDAQSKVKKLEDRLKAKGLLDKASSSDQTK